MRSHGLVELPVGFGGHDHVCWSYAHDDERTDVALAWLREGAERGCLPIYVGPDGSSVLQAWSDAGQSGPLVAFGVDDLYDLSRPINAPEQIALYASKVDAAVAAGSAGVRVFADTTRLLTDHSRWDSHASWEHQADQWMAAGGRIAAMCAYDSRRIRPQVIASLHPARYVPEMYVPFSLHAGPGGLIFEGSADALCAETFGEALSIVSCGGLVTIDVNYLEFIDGHSAALLARRVGQAKVGGTAIRFVGRNQMLRRLWELLELDPDVIEGVS